MPDKPKKYDLKVWALTELSSGYIIEFQVYEGRRVNTREVSLESTIF